MFNRKKPLVSIVIPSWFQENQNGKYGENETFWFAWECLQRLIAITPKELYELIIVDNGSSSMEMKAKEWTEFYSTKDYFDIADIVIRNKTNLGFAPACNQGFNIARGEYIVCLNNDIIIYDKDWINIMVSDFTSSLVPPMGILMPALMRETGDAREALKLESVDTTQNHDALGAKAEFGSMWMAKTEVLKEIAKNRDGYQVFDENFKLGMGEDRWLWQEIRMKGLETYRTHKIRVFHQGNMSMTKISNRRDYTTKNREYLAELKDKHNIK
jgi:GT2 family glycosyltransferase